MRLVKAEDICAAFIVDSCMRKFFSFRLRWNDGVYDFLLGNFNLENGGLRCCWWGEVKLIQNSSFQFHSHFSPRFPEKKVGKNTFRAFTGKLEKPINLRCRGGDASSDGWMILTSLENEQSASYGYATSLQIIFWRDVPGGARKIAEKNPVLFLLLTKALHELFCMWDMMRKDDCPVRLFAQRLAESLYLPFFVFFFPSSPVAALSAIDVSLVSGMKQNSSQLCSTIVCWLLWHNDLHFARHFGRD